MGSEDSLCSKQTMEGSRAAPSQDLDECCVLCVCMTIAAAAGERWEQRTCRGGRIQQGCSSWLVASAGTVRITV